MRRKRGKKVSYSLMRNTHNMLIAWDMLQSKMQKLNLSVAEQELIKSDILHKEAELNRKMYIIIHT
jgi:hypothetical protein